MSPILLSRAGRSAEITLNRPDRINAMNAAAWRALIDAFDEIDRTAAECDVLIFRGAGERGFCAGHDLSAFDAERRTRDQVRAYSGLVGDAMRRVAGFRGVTIAAIHGFCMGAGLQIALECDLRFARADTTLGLTPKKVGLFLEYELIDALCAAVGQARALEIVLEGAPIDTAHALRLGLVTEVATEGEFVQRLEEIVASAAATGEEGSGCSIAAHRARLKPIRRP